LALISAGGHSLSVTNGGTITSSGTYGILGVGGLFTATATGPINVLLNVTGVLSTFDITSTGGASTIVDEFVGVGAAYNLTANGGSITTVSTLTVLGTNNVTIENAGTYTVDAALISALSGSTIDFAAGTGNLFHITDVGGLSLLSSSPVIQNFAVGTADTILDDDIKTASVTHYKIVNTGGHQAVTFYSGSGTGTNHPLGTLDFASGTFTTGTFSASAGPLDIKVGSTSLDFTRCFLTGTHIQTPAGEANVETLKIGDEILAADGSIRAVRWVGINTISSRFADPLRFMPIRIKAGALGDALPVRDLLVSPDHAMFVDGVLIHASALVNGLTILREQNMPETFVYYHVEVEDHALILSEGAASESFVDNADRMAFDNWAEHVALYGDTTSISEMDYPRAQSARQVPAAIRARLSDRADRMLGWSLAQAA
jgi:hypothetical protein